MIGVPSCSRRDAIAIGAAGLLLPGAAWAAGDQPIVSKIDIEDDRLWLAASIGGGKPRLFCVDTGAPNNFLRPEIASELKLPMLGGRSVGGLGKNQVTSGVVVAHDLVIGGTIRIPQTAFTLYDFGRGLPPDAAGLIAAGIFTGRDGDVDFAANEWRLWPRGRPVRPDMTLLPSRFVDGDGGGRWADKMELTAVLDGKPYRLIADTGAPGGVLIFSTAARTNRLFDDITPFAVAQTTGFGGHAAKLSRVMRMRSLQMGPLTIDRPLVTVMDPDQQSRFDHDGLIGLSLLQLLTLSTDTRARKVWAARNDRPLPPEHYRLAGLWLDRADDGAATVAVIGTGSPAAAAGIRAGDVVVDPPRFEDALQRIGRRAGSEVALGLRRDGAVTTRRYTIQPYL